MTGPSYPRPPIPGGLGGPAGTAFEPGISPVGMYDFDVWTTIISQYANSPILDAIITSFNAAMNMNPLIDSWYDMIWNIETAQGYGLDVWGRIVGVTRALALPGAVVYLGFDEATGWGGFGPVAGGGILYSGGALTTNFFLSDNDFRTLILAKAAGNISNCAIPAVNAILLALFPGKVSYIVDGLNMTATYQFNWTPTIVQLAILAQANVLPNPAGVAITISHL